MTEEKLKFNAYQLAQNTSDYPASTSEPGAPLGTLNMVLGGNHNKFKISTKEPQDAAKVALTPASHGTSARPHIQKQKLLQTESPGESDIELFPSQNSPHESAASPVPLKQFECMLQKALKQTSEHITSSFTKEIREIGARTAALEIRVDELEISAQNNMSEIENTTI